MAGKGRKSPPKKKAARRRPRRRRSANAQLIRHAPNIPIPERMRTSFYVEADYKVPIATASISSGAVKLNSAWLPFRPGGSSAFPSYTFLGPATESTLLPTGFSQLCSANLYQLVKVVRSTIMIRWNGSNSGNNVVLTVVPALDIASFSTIYTVRAAPLARQATFSVSKGNSGTNRGGWFRYSINPYILNSATNAEAKGDLTAGVSGFNLDASINFWWHVYLQSNDLDVTATTASLLQVRVRYDVELFQLTQMSVT